MKEKQRPPIINIKSTPETYISQRSNPKEVQEWLKAKGFEQAICNKFKGVSGYQLLGMSKEELEKVCGEKTGARLYSFLLVQKSVSGVSYLCITLYPIRGEVTDKNCMTRLFEYHYYFIFIMN